MNIFDGRIDEPRIYNRALSAAEITNLYNSNISKYDVNKRKFNYIASAKSTEYRYIFTGKFTDVSGNIYQINQNFYTLGIPALVSPANGVSLATGTTDLLRSPVTSATTTISGYLYNTSIDSSFTTIAHSGTTAITGVTISGLNNAVYYRRIAAYTTS